MTDRIRVLIADDNPIYRDGMRRLIERAPDLELIGEAEDGLQAIELAAEGHPDIVLMDHRMPGATGIEAMRRILEADPCVGVLILTTSKDDELLFTAIGAGARGCIPKNADAEELLHAIRAADGRRRS